MNKSIENQEQVLKTDAWSSFKNTVKKVDMFGRQVNFTYKY